MLRIGAILEDADKAVDVSLPTVGMVVTGVCRWSKPGDDVHSWLCGLELDTASIDTRKWRQIVDSTRES